MGVLDIEASDYKLDKQVHAMAENLITLKDPHVDVDFWGRVSGLRNRDDATKKRFPTLSVLVKALLSVFSGSIVESSFNIMDYIIREDRSTMTTENYEATAVIKSSLWAKGIKAVDLEVSSELKTAIINSHINYKIFQQEKKESASKLQGEREKQRMDLPSHREW